MIRLRDLAIAFPSPHGEPAQAVRGVSIEIGDGDRVGLVGESGSGKSLTALACVGLVPEPGRVVGGTVEIDGLDVADAPVTRLREVRGGEIGVVFQEAAGALNPVYTVGFQLAETVRAHRPVERRRARELAMEMLQEVAIEEPDQVFRSYPHELSGGQAQRVMLATALAGGPRTLIADEPTSELDPITRMEVLELIGRLTREHGLGLLLISHDLEVVRGAVDRVIVMYGGRIVEEGPTAEVFAEPLHPYTRGLLASIPGWNGSGGGNCPHPVRPFARPAESGCPFEPRCGIARSQCRETVPALLEVAAGRRVRCPVAAGSGTRNV
jgi:oligopeptide/dipeptide ABC transporter ATP-binding protein